MEMSEYLDAVREQSRELRGEELGAFWAGQVITSPGNGTANVPAWKELGVDARYFDPYTRLVTYAVDSLSHDPEAYAGFMAELARRQSELPSELNAAFLAHVARLAAAPRPRHGSDQPVAGRDRPDPVAAGIRAARVRDDHIDRDPAAAFAEFARTAGITAENIAAFDVLSVPGVLEAAGAVVRQAISDDIEPNPLVWAVLERGVLQPAGGFTPGTIGWRVDDALIEYRNLGVTPALTAASAAEHWRELVALHRAAGFSPGMLRSVHHQWRSDHIIRGLHRRNVELIDAAGQSPEFAFPVECDRVTVEVAGDHLRYGGVDDLISALRGYFAPEPDASIGETGVATLADLAVGGAAARLNMDGLDAEIRSWHAAGGVEPFLDGEARERDTYRDGPGWFQGHGIRVDRAADGGVTLRFPDRGSEATAHAHLERFAAFHRGSDHETPVSYAGGVRLKYRVTPPIDLEQLRLQPATKPTDDRVIGALEIPVPLTAILAHLQLAAACDDQTVRELEQAIRQASRAGNEDQPVTITAGDVTFETDLYAHRLNLVDAGEGQGVVSVQQVARRYADSDPSCRLPEVTVSVQHSDPSRNNAMIAALVAQSRLPVDSAHPAGVSRSDPPTFSFNVAATAVLLAQVLEARRPATAAGPSPAGSPPRPVDLTRRTPRPPTRRR